jgi:hypothetical protein
MEFHLDFKYKQSGSIKFRFIRAINLLYNSFSIIQGYKECALTFAIDFNPIPIRILEENLFNSICPDIDFVQTSWPIRIRNL